MARPRRPTTVDDQKEGGHQSRPRLGDWLWLAVALALNVLVRLPFLWLPMIADEGGYAYATRGWIDGTGQLYHDLWISRPQGIFLIYATIFETLGTGQVAFRVGAAIFAAATAVAVWLYGRRWTGSGNLASIIFVIAAALPSLEGYTANAEVFMAMPAAFAALWLFWAGRHGWGAWHLAGVGALIGLATLLKPSGVMMLPVAWAFIVMAVEAPARAYLHRCAAVLAGIVIVAIPTFINGAMLGWQAFIYATITYRVTSQSSATVSFDHHLDALRRLAASSWALLLLLGLFILVRYRASIRAWLRSRSWRLPSAPLSSRLGYVHPSPLPPFTLARPEDDGGLLLRLWAFGCLGGISMGGDWWPHYLIQAAAPFAIWLGSAWPAVESTLSRRAKPAFLIAMAVLLLFPYWILTKGSTGMMTQAIYSHPGYPSQAQVAAYIKAHTTPDQTIFVAFNEAAIYYLADRKAAYRHLYDQELQAVPNAYADIIAVIRSPDRPVYIVGTRQPGPFPDDSRLFWREVANYYDLETMIDGVPIYRARNSVQALGP